MLKTYEKYIKHLFFYTFVIDVTILSENQDSIEIWLRWNNEFEMM